MKGNKSSHKKHGNLFCKASLRFITIIGVLTLLILGNLMLHNSSKSNVLGVRTGPTGSFFGFWGNLFSFITPKSASGSIKTATSLPNACVASDPQSLKNCISQVMSGQTNAIEISSVIQCSDSVTCSFLLSGTTQPITIYGTTQQDGIYRSGSFNYSFQVYNSSNVTIKNLTFTDSSDACDPTDDTTCAPMVKLNNDSNVIIDSVVMNNARRAAIEINASRVPPSFTISNSSFSNEAAHGILTNYVVVTGGIGKILNNTFTNSASNAVAFDVLSNSSNPSVIQGNTFIHNHHLAIYNSCGSTQNLPCPGGQLYIQPNTTNLQITGNVFKDGYADVTTANPDIGVDGVEINYNSVHTVSITNNAFLHDTSGLIINCTPATGDTTSGVSITSNYFGNNINHNTYFCNYSNPPDVSQNYYEILPSSTATGLMPLRGWNYDSKGISNIQIFVDDQYEGVATLQTVTLPNFPDSSHFYQFDYTVNTKHYFDGSHTIKIVSTNTQGAVETLRQFSVNFQNGVVYTPPNVNPIGNFDTASCTNFLGWTCDANNYSSPLVVHFYVDGSAGQGTFLGYTKADGTREQAVANLCGGYATHGFSLTTPASVKDGKPHAIYAYAINIPSGTNLLLSGTSKTITCN